ncbi:integrase core domain-containing protein, partial [Streptomonospora algeriensis]
AACDRATGAPVRRYERARPGDLAGQGIAHKRTRPYRPQTNGKVERFHRTLVDEWAYSRPYTGEAERREALPEWLHLYNHHRFHSAVGGPPASRVTNLTGQNS